MNTNSYETIYIMKPNLGDNQVTQTINRYKNILKKYGGWNILIQHRGRRHLSYYIQNYYDGIYIQMNYSSNPHLITLLEDFMRLDNKICRYLTIRQNQLYKNKAKSLLN
uniref:30S ribosomal protein S6, chloroplastic n=1 Tax=Apophlaea sinclairii TaxID=212746 RepID=A0A1C9CBR6_9FLOR|nr:ribosomal protein S6 [Apophlaea sinclairii]AOM65840.1 ribosomal protein S6 [Apophlaea sinclairii]